MCFKTTSKVGTTERRSENRERRVVKTERPNHTCETRRCIIDLIRYDDATNQPNINSQLLGGPGVGAGKRDINADSLIRGSSTRKSHDLRAWLQRSGKRWPQLTRGAYRREISASDASLAFARSFENRAIRFQRKSIGDSCRGIVDGAIEFAIFEKTQNLYFF